MLAESIKSITFALFIVVGLLLIANVLAIG